MFSKKTSTAIAEFSGKSSVFPLPSLELKPRDSLHVEPQERCISLEHGRLPVQNGRLAEALKDMWLLWFKRQSGAIGWATGR